MKQLILLGLVALAAWYGWKHYPELIRRQPGHEAVVENRTGRTMDRIRLSVGGQTFVKERLPEGANAVFPFKVTSDASFTLVWQWENEPGERNWSGGMVPRGPMLQRHTMTVDGDGAVYYRAEPRLGT